MSEYPILNRSNSLSEFPTLSTAYPLHSRIKESILYLFICFCRQDSRNSLSEIENIFTSTYSLCKDTPFYINLLAQITLFTRDYINGRGERQVSYLLMVHWFSINYPIFDRLFNLFISKYGSWRDAIGIASYARIDLGYSLDHPLLLYLVEKINTQLYFDIYLAESSRSLSNVAKWIPRENKKDGWLFDILAEHWCEKFGCADIRYSQKCKLYRKICSRINRQLGTFEIKLCGGEVEPDAESANYPLAAFSKYSQKIAKYIEFEPEPDYSSTKPSQYYYANYGKFVSELSRIMFFGNSEHQIKISRLSSIMHYASRISGINTIWEKDISSVIEKFGIPNRNIITILDVGSSMRENGRLFDAISVACGLIELSRCRRALTVDHLPAWITFPEKASFSNLVYTFFDNIGVGSSKNIELTFDLLIQSFFESEMTEDELKQLTIVYISDMESNDLNQENVSIHSKITECFHKKYGAMPHIVYWGIGVRPSTPLPCDPYSCNASIISGSSISLFQSLKDIIQNNRNINVTTSTPFTNLSYFLRKYAIEK